MNHSKQISKALGQVARSRISKQGPAKESDRRIAERTYLSIQQTIEKNDRWSQAEVRDVLTFRDHNGAIWFLSIFNRHARLYLVLVRDASGVDIGWRSKEIQVGGLVESDTGKVGFGLTVEFSHFTQWRRGVMRDRPVSRASSSSAQN